MTDPDKRQGPTMEEILASIRKMIPEEEPPGTAEPAPPAASVEPAPPPPTEPPRPRALLLTRMVAEDGSIVRLDPAAAAPALAPPLRPVPQGPAPAPPESEPPSELLLTDPLPPLLPAAPAAPATDTRSAEPRAAAPVATEPSNGGAAADRGGSDTMEAFLRRLVEPQLKAWLDANLPAMVERMAQKVIDDIRREADRKDEAP